MHRSIRLQSTFSSAPTTAPSHSVMLSGYALDRVASVPIENLSITGSLSQQGYATLGFVAGGYVRSQFGFEGRDPGFALDFDWYVEGLHLRGGPKAAKAKKFESPLESEHALFKTTHTLGPSMERSLRWWNTYPNATAFHFIHGYDVHEYRSVVRSYWEKAAGAYRQQSEAARKELDQCMSEVGITMDEHLVVHHPFKRGEAFRYRIHPRTRPCHRLIASVMYEARVRSTEKVLARYLTRLQQLGIYDRALVVLTSDHGEGLMDEHGYWGHNRPLVNNLHVPTWIKLPGATAASAREIGEVVGVIDLRATVSEAAGVPFPADMEGRDVLSNQGPHGPVTFGSGDHRGFILQSGLVCRWNAEGSLQVAQTHVPHWRGATSKEGAACAKALGAAQAPNPNLGSPPTVPEDLREELESLGYVE